MSKNRVSSNKKPSQEARSVGCGRILGWALIVLLVGIALIGISQSLSGQSVESNTAKTRTIALDPGHGGNDFGAIYTNPQGQLSLTEKEINLQLALKTAERLRKAGYKVVLTRSDNGAVNNPPRDLNGDGTIDVKDDLIARIELVNRAQADLLISIHVNSSSLGNSVGGVESWYCADRPFATENKVFAELVQKEVLEGLQSFGYSATNRGVQDDLSLDDSNTHLAMLGPITPQRKFATNMPGVLSEVLFISNDEERAILSNSRALDLIADGYNRAVRDYFGTAARLP